VYERRFDGRDRKKRKKKREKRGGKNARQVVSLYARGRSNPRLTPVEDAHKLRALGAGLNVKVVNNKIASFDCCCIWDDWINVLVVNEFLVQDKNHAKCLR
jgi:hypothetical protein